MTIGNGHHPGCTCTMCAAAHFHAASRKPDLSQSFPYQSDDLKINKDLDNRVHGSHFDILQSIKGGTDQTRITSDGDIIGGTTNIGKIKMNW